MIVIVVVSILFWFSLGSFQLAVQQERTPTWDKIGMFQSNFFSSLVMFPSAVILLASGIFLWIESFVLVLALFISTAVTFPLFGRAILIACWGIPYSAIMDWAEKKNSEQNQDDIIAEGSTINREVKCNNCGAELILEDKELKDRRFQCPSCGFKDFVRD